MGRLLIAASILGFFLGCAQTKQVAKKSAPSVAQKAEFPTLEPPEMPPAYVSGDPVVFVVFPKLGYSVLIPGQDWEFEKHFTPKGSKESIDLIMGHQSEMTTIVVQAYWDDNEDQRESIYDLVSNRRWMWSRKGFGVGPEDYRVDDKGYFMEFDAVKKARDGATIQYWIVGARLHRLPGAVVMISGHTLKENEQFMRENVEKVIRGIQPFEDQE